MLMPPQSEPHVQESTYNKGEDVSEVIKRPSSEAVLNLKKVCFAQQ